MQLTPKEKKQIRWLSICLLISLLISYFFYSNAKTYTYKEFVDEIHKEDSIRITEKEPEYAIIYLKKNLNKRFTDCKITKRWYSENEKAYKINFNITDTVDNKTYEKTAIIRIEFQINKGDYIAKPKIIRIENRE